MWESIPLEEDMKTAKERVREKFNLAKDLKKNKISTSIRIKEVDGKVMADVDIEGLPTKPQKNGLVESSYKHFTKIFDSFDEFTKYAKNFFGKSDEEIIQIAKGE